MSFRDEHDSALARAKALSAFFEQNTWVISLAQLMKSHHKSGNFRMLHFLPVHFGVLLVFLTAHHQLTNEVHASDLLDVHSHGSISCHTGVHFLAKQSSQLIPAGAVARGDAAINLRFPRKGYREKIWDHAAGSLIVTQAGATISDASGNFCMSISGKENYCLGLATSWP